MRAVVVALGVVAAMVLTVAVVNAPDVETRSAGVAEDDELTEGTTPDEPDPEGDDPGLAERLSSLAALASIALVILLLWRGRGGQGRPLRALIVLLLLIATVLLLDYGFSTTTPGDIDDAIGDEAIDGGVRAPSLVWLLALGLAGAALVWLLYRRRREPMTEDGAVDAKGDAVAMALGELESIADPRQAVVTAYARMEHALATAGIPRSPSETSREFVSRVLLDGADGDAVHTLGRLYERARFDTSEITAADRERAVAALRQIQANHTIGAPS